MGSKAPLANPWCNLQRGQFARASASTRFVLRALRVGQGDLACHIVCLLFTVWHRCIGPLVQVIAP